jgi:1-acyl-sn-glycerol-3-phosphate acyltransferase
MLYRIVIAIVRPLIKLYFDLEVKNYPKELPQDKLIIAGNHITWIDPVWIAVATRRRLSFLAKKELFNNWFVRKFFLTLGMFPVDRGAPDRKAITFAMDVLDQDRCLGIFPEGTRGKDKDKKAHNGTAYLAMKTGAPILPVTIVNDNKKFRSKVTLIYHEIIYVEKAKRIQKQEMNKITEIVMGKINQGLSE